MTDIERCKEFYSKYPDGTFADSVEAEFARDMFYAGWDAFAECVKEAQQWQPIETAPKDGTIIIVSTKNGLRYVVSYDDVFAAPWRIINEFGFSETTPTHWMPLPQSPELKGE